MDKKGIIKIDKIDRKILSAIEVDARTSINKIAKISRISRTVAEYRLKQFKEKEIIRGYYSLLDPSRFGLTVWKLWITFKNNLMEERNDFFTFVENDPHIWWYAECIGIYDAVICVLAKTPHDFNNFFKRLQERYGKIIIDSAILINVSFEYHTRGYLLDTPSKLIGSSFQEKPFKKKISNNAIEILRILSKNSRISYTELSKKTKRDVKTIIKNIHDLKNTGVIVYFRPSINVFKLGYEYYKVLLYLHNPRGGILPSIIEWGRSQNNIVAIISCVGPWQIELEIEIDTYRKLCEILTRLKYKFPDVVKRYETLLIEKEGNYELDLMDKFIKMESYENNTGREYKFLNIKSKIPNKITHNPK